MNILTRKRKFDLIPEDRPVPSFWKKLFMPRHSIIIKLLKRDDSPIILTLIGLFLAVGVLQAHISLIQSFYDEKVVTALPSNYVRVAKAAEITNADLKAMTIPEYASYKFGSKAPTVMQIMNWESGGNPYAINKNVDREGTFDLGCMQLNEKWQLKPRGLTRADAFDCKKSIDVSHQIYTEQGNFCAWSSYKSHNPKQCV